MGEKQFEADHWKIYPFDERQTTNNIEIQSEACVVTVTYHLVEVHQGKRIVTRITKHNKLGNLP